MGHRDRAEGSHVRHWRGHVGPEAAIGEASTPQGAPRTAWGHQNPGATPGTDPAPDSQKEPDLPRPWPRPSGLQACEGVNLRCLKPPGLWACVTAATGRGRSCRGRRRGGVGARGRPGPWGRPAPVPSLPGPPCSGASQTPASPPRLRPGRWSHVPADGPTPVAEAKGHRSTTRLPPPSPRRRPRLHRQPTASERAPARAARERHRERHRPRLPRPQPGAGRPKPTHGFHPRSAGLM